MQKQLITALVGAGLFTATAAPAAMVIYEEKFPNNTGSTQTLASAGWKSHRGDSAVDRSSSTATGAPGVATFTGPDSAAGRVHHGSYERYFPWIYWTEEQSFGQFSDLESISAYFDNNEATDVVRLVIRVGASSWYASHQTFTDPNAGGGTFSKFEVDFDNATFGSMSFSPGTSAPGENWTPAAAASISGEVTAIGYRVNKVNNNIRFDDVTVSAVPEPAALSLVGVAAVAMLSRRRAMR